MASDTAHDIMKEDDQLLPTPPSVQLQQTPVPTSAPKEITSHLKPNKPLRYYGKKDHNIVEAWIASVNSFFALINASAFYIYHYLNTIFGGEAAIWFRYHFPDTAADTLQ